MLDWWKGYITAWRHLAASADWTEPAVQFLVTLLAGGISLLVARWSIAHQEKVSSEKATASERVAAGDAVTLALHKLIDCGEILGGMRNLLDEQFIQASADGYASEPFQVVRPSQGRDYSPRRVELSEISFLSKAQDLSLISDISLVYRRTLNCIHLSEEHGRERTALAEWVEGLPGYKGKLLGDIANDAFPTEFQNQFDRRAANINLTIVSWVEQVEDTIVLIEDVMRRLRAALKTEFGKDFPVITATFTRKTATLEDIRRACAAAGVRFEL